MDWVGLGWDVGQVLAGAAAAADCLAADGTELPVGLLWSQVGLYAATAGYLVLPRRCIVLVGCNAGHAQLQADREGGWRAQRTGRLAAPGEELLAGLKCRCQRMGDLRNGEAGWPAHVRHRAGARCKACNSPTNESYTHTQQAATSLHALAHRPQDARGLGGAGWHLGVTRELQRKQASFSNSHGSCSRSSRSSNRCTLFPSSQHARDVRRASGAELEQPSAGLLLPSTRHSTCPIPLPATQCHQ